MNIIESSASYERWLHRQMNVVSDDLEYKHQCMREAAFPFLRATFYRWMQHWDANCSEFNDAPKVLAVGDLHIENFGTWRDLDGRLIWGVNDFDEAFSLPYVIDLVRLGASAALAIAERHFKMTIEDAIDAIIDGYELGLEKNGEPFVLEEHHRWLRKIALSELREPAAFWKKMRKLEVARGRELERAKRVLISQFPQRGLKPQYFKRVAGLGSLGRPRFVALADCGGSFICREAKRLAPSAVLFARGLQNNTQHTGLILQKAKRVNDPFYIAKDGWLVRRLAPHCCKIELGHLPAVRDELDLMLSMGSETANIHLGSVKARHLAKDLGAKRRRKIRRAIETMTQLTLEDWRRWKKPR